MYCGKQKCPWLRTRGIWLYKPCSYRHRTLILKFQSVPKTRIHGLKKQTKMHISQVGMWSSSYYMVWDACIPYQSDLCQVLVSFLIIASFWFVPWEIAGHGSVLGLLPSCGRSRLYSRLLALNLPGPVYCGPVGSEPADRRSWSFCLFLLLN